MSLNDESGTEQPFRDYFIDIFTLCTLVGKQIGVFLEPHLSFRLAAPWQSDESFTPIRMWTV